MREIVGGLLQYKDGNQWKDIPALVGKTGDKGDIGNTPNLSIGTVTALDTGESPTATLTGTTDAPVLNLGLPRGLTGEVTEQELDDALKLKGDCFTDVATGAIASFSDGADDTPINGMTVDITPVQSYNGYDKPWAGGAGKNMINPALIEDGYINASGEQSGASGWSRTKYIEIEPSTTYTFSVDTTAGNNAKHAFYDSTETFISVINSGSSTFTTPNDAKYIRLSFRAESTTEQLELGSTATDYEPYENICPITGWENCRLEQTGKNIFNIANTYNYNPQTPTSFPVSGGSYYRDFYTDQTGSGSTISSSYMPKLLYLKKGTYKTYYSTGENITIFYISPTGTPSTLGNSFNNYEFTLERDSFITIRRRTSSATTYSNFMVCIGNRTVYEPYKGTVRTLAFGSTIYAGQISIAQDGTVKLKVYPYYSSYNGEELTGKWVSSMDEYVAGATPTTGAFVVDLSGQYTEEITLTPITPIKTLLGVNNIWADCGDVAVTYRADTKLYIDRKVASLV